jgi:hypothetical protein
VVQALLVQLALAEAVVAVVVMLMALMVVVVLEYLARDHLALLEVLVAVDQVELVAQEKRVGNMEAVVALESLYLAVLLELVEQ